MVDSTPTVHGPPSITMSMRPRRSASTCAALVGETWPERLAEGATTGPPKAASSACASGCAGTRTATLSSPASARSATGQSSRFGSNERQRPRPERRRQLLGVGIEARQRVRGLAAGHMRDQRIERRPPLGGIEPRHRLAIAGVGAEPVDGLGRKRDQPAALQAARGRRNRVAVGLA